MNRIKSFFSIVKYESIRLIRHKFIFIMLIIFPIVLILGLHCIQSQNSVYSIAIYTDDTDIEDCQALSILEDNLNLGERVFVDCEEDGLNLVNKGKVCFFICLDKGMDGDQTTATLYYDKSSTIGYSLEQLLNNAKNEYAYNSITEYLGSYGITLNETYFQLLEFKTTQKSENANFNDYQFSIEVGVALSTIMLLGLAFSISRDNETKVSKNLAYIPLSSNTYLLSKMFPFLILGIFESFVVFLLGKWMLGISYQINILIVIFLSILFILSILSLYTLLSLLKNQVATIFVGFLFIIIPIFVYSSIYIPSIPAFFRIILNFIPMISYVSFLNGMIASGMILYEYIFIFLLQTIVFYLLALVILKNNNKYS